MSFSVLIVEDDASFRHTLHTYLEKKEYEVFEADTLEKAREHIKKGEADIILLDEGLPDGSGMLLLEETMRMPFHPPVIIITGHADVELAVSAMKIGALDFLLKPLKKFDSLEQTLTKATDMVSMQRELAHVHKSQFDDLDFVIGHSPIMQELYQNAQRAAQACVSVLITGETGTGKDVLAKAIHKMGPRAGKMMVDINCPAIQDTVIESELFGYEPGAFTSAVERKHGLIELADGGILLLDEIASMKIESQVKLLRVLQERTLWRVGGKVPIKVDVQVIAISNRNLRALIEAGQFRDDLYYRLKVVDLEVPPLRKHKEDIPELIGRFVDRYSRHAGLNITGVTPRAMEALMAYDWPGNIRELEFSISRAVTFCDDELIDLPHLPKDVIDHS
ncbi:MAG: sigma-54 dependent transcriptional regulator [Anaerolineales bacterium]|nr:sigma-54 dependent transcriptional regulator [Anaerolineales bacterium]